jgi:hypothetical protein
MVKKWNQTSILTYGFWLLFWYLQTLLPTNLTYYKFNVSFINASTCVVELYTIVVN